MQPSQTSQPSQPPSGPPTKKPAISKGERKDFWKRAYMSPAAMKWAQGQVSIVPDEPGVFTAPPYYAKDFVALHV